MTDVEQVFFFSESALQDVKSDLIAHLDKGSDIDPDALAERHQAELVAMEIQLKQEQEEMVAKYESEAAIKQALHDQAIEELENKHSEEVNMIKVHYICNISCVPGMILRIHVSAVCIKGSTANNSLCCDEIVDI